ncbi:hypothetical protein LCGC14_3137150, partial [marine sediment metagenome]
ELATRPVSVLRDKAHLCGMSHKYINDIVRKHIPWDIVAELGKRVLV